MKLITILAVVSMLCCSPTKSTPSAVDTSSDYADVSVPSVQTLIRDSVLIKVSVLYVKGKQTRLANYVGSGVIIAKDTVLTAGHVCNATVQGHEKGVDIIAAPMAVFDYNDVGHNATVVKTADSPDLCILHADKLDVGSVGLAANDPQVGSAVRNVSSPAGFKPDHGMYVVDGYFSGEGLDGSGDPAYFISMPIHEGSSGSGLFYNDKLAGIVVAYLSAFDHIAVAVPLSSIRAFINSK